MKEKRWTERELLSMPSNEFECMCIMLRAKAYRLLGIDYKKRIIWHIEPVTGDIVVQYE